MLLQHLKNVHFCSYPKIPFFHLVTNITSSIAPDLHDSCLHYLFFNHPTYLLVKIWYCCLLVYFLKVNSEGNFCRLYFIARMQPAKTHNNTGSTYFFERKTHGGLDLLLSLRSSGFGIDSAFARNVFLRKV